MPALEAASGPGVIPRVPSRRVRRLLENLEAYAFLLPAIVVLGVVHLFTIVSVGLAIPLALFFAVLLNRKLRGMSWYRTAFFIPHVTSLAAAAMVWHWLYNPDQFRLLNYLLDKVGIPPQRWLLDPVQAMLAIIAVSIWSSLGRDIVLFLAGLQSISQDYYEACRIEGDNNWHV